MHHIFSLFEISLDLLVLLHQGKRTEESKRNNRRVKKGKLSGKPLKRFTFIPPMVKTMGGAKHILFVYRQRNLH